MKKTLFVTSVVLLLSLGIVAAITQQEINEAKSLIDSKADCKSLSNSQLEIIGEYSMEQMHPGEAHELMHKMMGLKEGSEAEEQFHINMAKTIYCSESSGMMGSGGMMNMMGGGMMGNYPTYYRYGYDSFWNILWPIFLIGVLVLIIWIIYKLIKKGDKRVKIMEKDKNTLMWILVAVIVAIFLLGGPGMGGYSIMGFGMGFGFIFMLLFWGLIIWLIITLFNANQSSKKESEDSLTILKKRYASGEITKKHYEKMRKELTGRVK